MSMSFTSQEHDIMVANTKKIEEYLRSIMPQLRDGFTIGFGGMVHRGWCNEFYEPQYELHISKDRISGHSGGLGVQFKESGDSDFTVYLYGQRAFADGYMSALLKEWTIIKAKILEKINQQNSMVSAIYNFEL